MKTIDIVKTANKNVWSAKIRSLLTMCAIFIGAFVLTLSVAIGEGTKEFVDAQTKNFAMEDTLTVTGEEAGINVRISGLGKEPAEYEPNKGRFGVKMLTNEDRLKIERVENVESVSPNYYINPEYLEVNGKKFTTSTFNWSDRMNLKYAAGSNINLNDSDSILLGYGFTGALGYNSPSELMGKSIDLVFKDPLGLKEDKIVTLEVEGVVAGSIFYNDSVLISQQVAEDIYKYINNAEDLTKQTYPVYNAFLKRGLSEEDVQKVRDDIKEHGFGTSTSDEQAAQFQSVVTTIQAGLAGFSIIAILAASFGIINTLLMSVYERINEIGLMKALGMKRRGIFTLFALEATVIGFWGSIAGVATAVISGKFLNDIASTSFLKDLEGFTLLIFPLKELVIIVFAIMLIAFFAGTLPAIKAMRLKPIEALRYE